MLLCTTGNAQYVKFATSGIITYEKRANMYAIIKSNINKDNETYMQKSFENYQKTQPQFKTSISTLTFTQNQSLYKPGENNETVNNIFLFPAFEQNNLVYTDIASKISWSQKKVFEETFLVKDSLRNIKWKITDETRNIAGYECQRANAIIMDSIYVVAFYTDEIIATGGPESFTGLPGMILGIALPHEHVTWFATQVVDKPVALKELNPPIKGTPVNRNTLKNSLQNSFKNYNKFIQDALRFYLL
ncbi:: hypothetical protein [Arcticibacter svalbardensis MN12-7]|uniref:GLPGLI family protein n=2 Tax=Arcticibacter TaxID=1288026 RepID=R9GUG0_9SPHI|nr:: hypothetical protein [Arcticibacter svalbardensis MN12-7]